MILLLAAIALIATPVAAQNPMEIVVSWPEPDARALPLLQQLGTTSILAPPESKRPAIKGIPIVADLTASTSLAEVKQAVVKARSAGYDGAAIPAAGTEPEFREFLQTQKGFVQFVALKADQLSWDVAPARALLVAGNPPGLQSVNTESAAATEKPWINTNLHLYAYLRAVFPSRPAWLMTPAPKPDVRYDAVEVALAEAFASGGHTVLSIPGMYREGLLKGTPRAVSAWQALANFAKHLRQLPGWETTVPASSSAIVTGSLDEFEEILNLPFRNNLSPRVVPAGRLPALTAAKTRVLVVVNQELNPEQARWATGFAQSGGILVTAPPTDKDPMAWLTAAGPRNPKVEKPWTLWELGKGKVYRYPEPIIDPSEFAFDLKEISGLDNPRHTGLHGLDFRVWNAATVLGVIYEAADGGKTLVLTSYGQGRERDFLVGVRGDFTSATLLTPGAPPQPLELMKRDWFVEVNMNGVGRQGIIEFRGSAK